MRVDLHKILFIGAEADREAFFQKAQDAGIIHFIEKTTAKLKDTPEGIQKISSAIKILRHLPVAAQDDLDAFDLADGLVHKILELKQEIEKISEEERITRMEMARVGVFGGFSREDVEYIEKHGNRKVQFFFSKHGMINASSLPETMFYIGEDFGLDYFVSISKTPVHPEPFTEMRVEKPLQELALHAKELANKIGALEDRLKTYAKYETFLHHALVYKLNSYHLDFAQNQTSQELNGSLFAVFGWVPTSKLQELKRLTRDMHVYIEEIAIEAQDVVPTYLENSGTARIGEDVINIYDTPSATDKDPSLWVLFAFAFFFAFIVGDGGYGLVFLAIALYARHKMRKKKTSSSLKRFMNLALILCTSCIAWGFLMNSFFGISFAPSNPLRQASLMQWLVEKKAAYHIEKQDDVYSFWIKQHPALETIKEPKTFVQEATKTASDGKVSYELANKFSDNIMMELALLVGTLHILISLGRYLFRNLPAVGWIALIIGGYLYIPHYLGATSFIHFLLGIDKIQGADVGLYLVAGGFSAAILLAVLKNGLFGILEATNVIQIFSDIMSYLRLYALALAGSIVSATVNDVVYAVPLFIGVFIIAAGHLINMVLSIMGGVIHGLRLNFLEWYHYSFEGDGKPFKPLRKMKIIE